MARIPWRRRSAPSASSAPRTDFGPATSPVLGLQAAEPDADDASLSVLRRVADDRIGLLERESADDVGSQPHLDSGPFARLLGAVAVAAEDLIPADATADALARREDRLDVDGAVG
jgi:hypothetical protein